MSNITRQDDVVSFWDNMSKDDFAVPRVKLGQKNDLGKFVYNTGGKLDVLIGVRLIVPTKTRVLYNGDKGSRCASDNYYNPSSRIKNPVSSNCLTCHLAQWGTSDEKAAMAKELGENVDLNKPMCAETYNLLMADGEGKLFYISFQKTQLKVVQQKLFSRLRYEFSGINPYHVEFDMHSEIVGGGKNQYANVVFDNFRVSDDAAKEQASNYYKSWKDQAASVLAKQHEDMDAAKDVTPKEMDDDEIPF